MINRFRAIASIAAPLGLCAGLSGCDLQVLFPAGDVARQEAHLLAITTLLILLVVVPVMVLIVVFAWRYRASNENATFRPEWSHSTALEFVIWSVPLLIIITLGAITWISTHTLDPYRPLDRIAPGKAIAADVKPLEVDVVALDWKWLFIYPEQGIATVNELALPVDRPVAFRITASSVMNSFYIPSLAGQVYAMPGMVTQLHAVINRPGQFNGFSANYSGAGFSDMHFMAAGLNDADFAKWVAARKASGGLLDRAAYLKLAVPSQTRPPEHWSSVEPELFRRATENCVAANQACIGDTMRADMGGKPMPGPMAGVAVPQPVDDAPPSPNAPRGALLRNSAEVGSSPRPAVEPANAPAMPHSHS